MSLADEYARQKSWRPWPEIYATLPPIDGQAVLDLGCNVGDQAAELAARGARVIGIDANEELLGHARSRGIPEAEFRRVDLGTGGELGVVADGIWSSFLPAFFPDLASTLTAWSRHLVPDGWIALTEVNDLFGHEPLSSATRALLDDYREDALVAGRYDFLMGRKLRGHLERAGFAIESELVLEDRELAFDGPALPDVIDAWHRRLGRMYLLQQHCGSKFPAVEAELLACLADPTHRSQAKVYFCLGRRTV